MVKDPAAVQLSFATTPEVKPGRAAWHEELAEADWGEGQVVITGLVISPTVTEAVVVEEQPAAAAVTVKTVFCMVPGCVLLSVPLMESPLPLAGMPVKMTVLSRVQEKVVPGTLLGLEREIALMAAPGQMVCVEGEAFTVGMGLIVILMILEILIHPVVEFLTVRLAL